MPEATAPPKNPAAGGRSLAVAGVLNATPFSALSSLGGCVARFLARRISKRPASMAAGATLAALLTGVALNALFFQKARHPAPLFEAAPVAAAAPVSSTAPLLPAVAALPAGPAQTNDSITGSTTAPPAAAGPAREQVVYAPPVREPRASEAPERGLGAERESAPVRHPKSAGKKAKKTDRISQFLKASTPHKHRAKRDED